MPQPALRRIILPAAAVLLLLWSAACVAADDDGSTFLPSPPPGDASPFPFCPARPAGVSTGPFPWSPPPPPPPLALPSSSSGAAFPQDPGFLPSAAGPVVSSAVAWLLPLLAVFSAFLVLLQ